ncbi:MAG: phospholipase [Gemmatimonadaceae bacterium]|nr:phospholipase [Gemmatimonadaceae bacterium]
MPADNTSDPHANGEVAVAGSPLSDAHGVVVMLHGRGATAESILSLAAELRVPGMAYIAPQAGGSAWYPLSFLAPTDQNEPWLSSALATVGRTVTSAEAAGIPAERIFLLGFSQGACLATEWVARNARRYGGLCALSGGLIGDSTTPRDYPGDLGGMPAFFGCSDVDAHIPASRVKESGQLLERLGARVDLRLYPGMGHTVNADEIGAVLQILDA